MTEPLSNTADLDEICRVAGYYTLPAYSVIPTPPIDYEVCGDRWDIDDYRYYTHEYADGNVRKFMRKLPDGKWIEIKL